MQAFKQHSKIKNGKITIDVPPDFEAEEVEVIILPVEESLQAKRERLKKLLLSAPTLTEEELKEFEEVRKWLNQWKIPEF